MSTLRHLQGLNPLPIFKVALGTPSHGPMHPDFALCMTNFCLHLMREPVMGYGQTQLKIINKRASLLPKQRQEIVGSAMKAGLEWLLFIDSDQTFPPNVLHRLASHKKNVVGCNIATKSIPSSPTARNRPLNDWPGGVPVYTHENSRHLEEVWRVGCGVMLLKLEVFKRIPKPWFQIVYQESMDDFTGEDWFLCERLEAAGEKIYVDHALSQEIGHIGDYTYGHKDVKVVKDPLAVAANIQRKLF